MLYNDFRYRYPPYPVNYPQQQQNLRKQLKPINQPDLDQLMSKWKNEMESEPNTNIQPNLNIHPSVSPTPINNRSGAGGGGALIGLGILARAAFPWVVGAAAVGGAVWLGYKGYEMYKKQKKENEIKEKVLSILYRLN